MDSVQVILPLGYLEIIVILDIPLDDQAAEFGPQGPLDISFSRSYPVLDIEGLVYNTVHCISVNA